MTIDDGAPSITETRLITSEEFKTVLAIRTGRAVVMPKEEYERCRQPAAADPGSILDAITRKRWIWRSRIARDREVAVFLISNMDRYFLADLRARCIEYFGPDRTPSRSGLSRFLSHVRREVATRK